MKLGSRVFPGRTRQADEEQPRDAPQRHHSLAVGYTLERFESDERKVEILDLGASLAAVLECRDATFVDTELYDKPKLPLSEPVWDGPAIWIDLHDPPPAALYPEGLTTLLGVAA